MSDTKDYYSIGDQVVITEGFFKGKIGRITSFDFSYNQISVVFRELSAVAYFDLGKFEHVSGATEGEAEAEPVPLGENPEKLDDEGGVWDTKAVVIDGQHKGLEGELIGPNKILTQKLGADMIDLRFEDGTVRSVRLDNVEFVPLVEPEETKGE